MQDGLWTGHEVTWWDIRTVLVIFWARWILRNTSTMMMCHMTNLIALLTGMKSIVTFKDNDPHSPDIHGVGRAILHSNAFLAWFRNYKLRLCDSSRLLRLYFEFMALHLLITAADTTYKRCSFNWNCVNGLTELWRHENQTTILLQNGTAPYNLKYNIECSLFRTNILTVNCSSSDVVPFIGPWSLGDIQSKSGLQTMKFSWLTVSL